MGSIPIRSTNNKGIEAKLFTNAYTSMDHKEEPCTCKDGKHGLDNQDCKCPGCVVDTVQAIAMGRDPVEWNIEQNIKL